MFDVNQYEINVTKQGGQFVTRVYLQIQNRFFVDGKQINTRETAARIIYCVTKTILAAVSLVFTNTKAHESSKNTKSKSKNQKRTSDP